MDCFPDFCLACDKQTTEGLYCSQACRLADLERSGSAPESPLTAHSSYSFANASWTNSHMGSGSGFYLPPAVDFGTLRPRQAHPSSSKNARSDDSIRDSQHYRISRPHSPSHTSTPQRILSPSSSRSSLVSGLSGLATQAPEGLSEQTKTELREYVNSFDQTREWRRRSYPSMKPTPTLSRINDVSSSFSED